MSGNAYGSMSADHKHFYDPNKKEMVDIFFDKFKQFNPYKQVTIDPTVNGYGYVFFTKPDLNIMSEKLVEEVSFFSSGESNKVALKSGAADYHLVPFRYFNELAHDTSGGTLGMNIIDSLSQPSSEDIKFRGSRKTGDDGFLIKLLSNMAVSFTPPDTTIKTKDVGETMGGYKIVTPNSVADSISGEFAMEFSDTQYLHVTKLFKAWIDYMDMTRRGFIPPKSRYINNKGYRILDYVSSMYYFRTLPDGETLTYWAKYTGVFPTNIPYSAFAMNNTRDIPSLSVNFSFSFKEDLDPEIINDFNQMNVTNNQLLERAKDRENHFNIRFNGYEEALNYYKNKGSLNGYDSKTFRTGPQSVVVIKDKLGKTEMSSTEGSIYRLKFIR